MKGRLQWVVTLSSKGEETTELRDRPSQGQAYIKAKSNSQCRKKGGKKRVIDAVLPTGLRKGTKTEEGGLYLGDWREEGTPFSFDHFPFP